MAMDAEALRTWLAANTGLSARELRNDTKLVSSGRLDSMIILDLCAFLEKEAKISINWMDVGIANIDSIDAILAFVARHR